MNKLSKFFIFSLLLFQVVIIKAQRGGGSSPLEQFNARYFPTTSRSAIPLNCNPAFTPPACNYFQNNNFIPLPGASLSDPFAQNQVPFWSNSHGIPRLIDPLLGVQPPPGVGNYALLPYAANNSGTANNSSGIVTRIAPTVAGQNYVMRFFEKNASFFFMNSLARVDIFLIQCNDYLNFPIGTNTVPPVPANSQHIFCETNYAATTQLAPWQNRVFSFTANGSYNMVWIYATPTNTGLFPPSVYCFTLPELINASTFNIFNNNANDPNTCLASLYPSCLPTGATVTWNGPNGQVFTSTSLGVDRSDPLNAGVWTATLTFPTADPHNSTCGNNIPASATINLTCCNCPPVNCINLPLVQ